MPLPSEILPNLPFQSILNVDPRSYHKPTSNAILFVGKLTYSPNSEGISWFLKEVWPQLLLSNPGIRMTLVSVTNPDNVLAKLIKERMGVTLKINIDDLDSEYQGHKTCIVPIFSGSGSNIKLTEALYHSRKVISTPFGARGFEEFVTPGLIKLAESPIGWVNAIESQLKEEDNEHYFIEMNTYFSFDNWSKKLIDILK